MRVRTCVLIAFAVLTGSALAQPAYKVLDGVAIELNRAAAVSLATTDALDFELRFKPTGDEPVYMYTRAGVEGPARVARRERHEAALRTYLSAVLRNEGRASLRMKADLVTAGGSLVWPEVQWRTVPLSSATPVSISVLADEENATYAAYAKPTGVVLTVRVPRAAIEAAGITWTAASGGIALAWTGRQPAGRGAVETLEYRALLKKDKVYEAAGVLRTSPAPRPDGYQTTSEPELHGVLPNVPAEGADFAPVATKRIATKPVMLPKASRIDMTDLTLHLAYDRALPAPADRPAKFVIADVEVPVTADSYTEAPLELQVDLTPQRHLMRRALADGNKAKIAVHTGTGDDEVVENIEVAVVPYYRERLIVDASIASVDGAGEDATGALYALYESPSITFKEGSVETNENYYGFEGKLIAEDTNASFARAYATHVVAKPTLRRGEITPIYGARVQAETDLQGDMSNVLAGASAAFLRPDHRRSLQLPFLELTALAGSETGKVEVQRGESVYGHLAARVTYVHALGRLFAGFLPGAVTSDVELRLIAIGFHDTRRDMTDGMFTLELLRGLSDDAKAIVKLSRGTLPVSLQEFDELVEFGLRTSF